MLITITNLTSRTINKLETIDTASYLPGNPAGLVASGGNRTDPLPYPFNEVGELAAGASIQRAAHVSDMRKKNNIHGALSPAEMLQQMVNAGIISLVAASETGRTDVEEELFGTI